MTWAPEFPGQRPPFEQGNAQAVTHGAFTPRIVEPAARALVDQVLDDEDNAHLRAPRWRPMLLNYARLQVRADRYGEHLDRLDPEEQMTPPRGGARAAVEVWMALVKAATNAADKLGLTPTSHAKLSKDLASTAAMSALGARHPLRAALERIADQRQAIEGTVVEPEHDEPVSDNLEANDDQ